MKPWRPALRMARRDLRRHKVRAVLTCLLVALPVFIATLVSLVAANDNYTREREAFATMLDSDASVRITSFSAVSARDALYGGVGKARGATERDPAAVDLEALLPEGSKVSAPMAQFQATLGTGGSATVNVIDLNDPLTHNAAELSEGRAPVAPDEVALTRAVSEESGGVGTTIELADGKRLRVVGTVRQLRGDADIGVSLLAPIGTILEPRQEDLFADRFEPDAILVDLPAMTRAEVKRLSRSLAAHGVAFQPRDAVLHPQAWFPEEWAMRGAARAIDPTPYIVGALCVLIGLAEVVLLVGAAFSIAARRQIRDLGLLSTNGGAPSDVRRVLLAQGVVLGVLSSALGAIAGVAVFDLLAIPMEDAFGVTLWQHRIHWPVVLVVALLGATTSVVAALLPGWRIGRLTPVEALSGRFPIKGGESRAHRGAFVLAGLGLAILGLGGWATAVGTRQDDQWTGVTAFLAGVGLLILLGGVAWSTPYLVRRTAALGQRLPLAGRYAFRDAGRHRFRTAATVIALTVTVAGAVLAGFGFKSAARASGGHDLAPHTAMVEGVDVAAEPLVRKTLDRVVDPTSVAATYTVGKRGAEWRYLEARPSYDGVQAVDEASLQVLVGPDEGALEVFRAGGIVAMGHAGASAPSTLVLRKSAGQPAQRWQLPVVRVKSAPGLSMYGPSNLISLDTAARLGLERLDGSLTVRAGHAISQNELDRLRVYGIWAHSSDPDRARLDLLQYAGLGVAGLLAAVVVGIAVALAAAEGRDDVATLAAVGAGPWRRRGFGAMHGLFIGLVGSALGLAIGVPAGMAFTQVDGLPGIDMAWLPTFGTAGVVLLLSWVIGGIVTPSRFRLTRRVA